ncbi:MAG: PD-(D/E)XK nuclease family protein [Prevotella sp.]|nr:PD-(D/E)XK nuclease family protein [Prevotella sp.]
MKSFLEYVADDMLSKYGTDLSRIAVVFPNKRASLFLNEHLARRAGRPLWSPAYITISELFRQQSPFTVADPIKLVCDLHKSFCLCTGSDETLDKFYGWGQLLITDFDDIDKNMADADRVFANVRDIHELDDITYLTDSQRAMLQRFFSNFSDDHNSELKERFLRLWSRFAAIYHDFNARLTAQGLAYEGALYRQVVTDAAASFPYDRYLFVGFNLLQKVEQRLFSRMQHEGKARFYWDFDHYYMNRHEAGAYIAKYLGLFPNELPTSADDIYRNFSRQKTISYMAAPTENIQARYVSDWLRENHRYRDGRRTAVVLCNEALLQTVIHCLPAEVDKVNVTTGYPLSQTPVASFIQLYFNMHLGGRSARLVRLLRHHPYAKYVEAELTTQQSPLTAHLLTMLRQIARNGATADADPLFQESLFRAYTLVNRLADLIATGDLTVSDTTLQRLVGQLIQQTTIPFHGEPAEGIQVMGVLETRNLDFDHVLLLSCNEGNMPRGVDDSSFIPHSIRRAYELTTVENKVGIYAYYFHRLLQRADDVTILYNNSTEDGQRGEMSRFMLQMMVESSHSIGQYTLQSGQSAPRWQPVPIAKTPHVTAIMQSMTQLSPTAVNRYIRCPLQFYYCYVADLREPDVPDDEQELDNRIFGNIFHEAADIIYHQLPNVIDKAHLDHLLHSKVEIERAVDEAFHRHLPNSHVGGLHLINREVIIRYLHQLLDIDRRLAPFTILGLECDVFRDLTVNQKTIKIGGRIDRLDMMADGTIRVVDYKTGGRRMKSLNDVDDIFSQEKVHDHSDYYLQTFLYADIVSRRPNSVQLPPSPLRVSPALLFIQHAGADDYDPTLCFGREPITDITDHAPRFNELLEAKVNEIFNPDIPFAPTTDLDICRTCPYALLCQR